MALAVIGRKLNKSYLLSNSLELSDDIGSGIRASVIYDDYFIGERHLIEEVDHVDQGRGEPTLLVVRRNHYAEVNRRARRLLMLEPILKLWCGRGSCHR